MKFIECRLETTEDKNFILPYWEKYRSFIEEGNFPLESFCLLLDSSYSLKMVRSVNLLENIRKSLDGWEFNLYSRDNPQLDAKDKIIPPNNLCGMLCCNGITARNLSQILENTISTLFKEEYFSRNEYFELFINNFKVMGLDSFQKNNTSAEICSLVSFFLLLSDSSLYSKELEAMSRKSTYKSLFSVTLDENSLKNIKKDFFKILRKELDTSLFVGGLND